MTRGLRADGNGGEGSADPMTLISTGIDFDHGRGGHRHGTWPPPRAPRLTVPGAGCARRGPTRAASVRTAAATPAYLSPHPRRMQFPRVPRTSSILVRDLGPDVKQLLGFSGGARRLRSAKHHGEQDQHSQCAGWPGRARFGPNRDRPARHRRLRPTLLQREHVGNFIRLVSKRLAIELFTKIGSAKPRGQTLGNAVDYTYDYQFVPGLRISVAMLLAIVKLECLS